MSEKKILLTVIISFVIGAAGFMLVFFISPILITFFTGESFSFRVKEELYTSGMIIGVFFTLISFLQLIFKNRL